MFRIALLSLLLSCPAALMAADKSPGVFHLTVEVSGVRNARGRLMVTLYASEDNWLDYEKYHRTRRVPAVKGRMTFRFAGLQPGTYGVAILHDENANGEMDMQWLPPGPAEGAAASNQAPARFGPPKWKDARMQLDKNHRISLPMDYP